MSGVSGCCRKLLHVYAHNTHRHLHVTAEANWLVEEFMVMANARVTEKCIEYCPDVALARYHGNPDPSRFTTLVNALEAKGIRFNTGSGLAMGKSLESLNNHANVRPPPPPTLPPHPPPTTDRLHQGHGCAWHDACQVLLHE